MANNLRETSAQSAARFLATYDPAKVAAQLKRRRGIERLRQRLRELRELRELERQYRGSQLYRGPSPKELLHLQLGYFRKEAWVLLDRLREALMDQGIHYISDRHFWRLLSDLINEGKVERDEEGGYRLARRRRTGRAA